MTVGLAIVIAMVLYLLDKHSLLKKAALLGIATLASVVVGIYAWSKYNDWKTDRYAQARLAMKQQLVEKYKNAGPAMLPTICADKSFTDFTAAEKAEVEESLSKIKTSNRDIFDVASALYNCLSATW
jgi:hypothetical protein